MPRILALDYGRRRTGWALSDPLGMLAARAGHFEHRDDASRLNAVRELCKNEKVSALVVGIPLMMDGSESRMSSEVGYFIKALEQDPALPVARWDERLTSKAADRLMGEMETARGKKRGGESDRIAASLILEEYLESRRMAGGA